MEVQPVLSVSVIHIASATSTHKRAIYTPSLLERPLALKPIIFLQDEPPSLIDRKLASPQRLL